MVGVPFILILMSNLISKKSMFEEFLEYYSFFGIESYHFSKKILHLLTYLDSI